MRKYKNCILFVIVLITLQIVCAVPDDATKAAQDSLQKFLKLIPKNMVTDYGFRHQQELETCELGTAFEVQTITPQTLRSYNEQDSMESLVQNTNMYYFTVTCLGENRAILVVAKTGEEWQAVSFGNIPLAKELQSLQKTWVQQRGFEPQLIIIYQAKQYFFHVPQLDQDNFTSIKLHSSRNVDYLRTNSLKTIVPSLWQQVQKNMGQEQKYQQDNYEQEKEKEISTSNAEVFQVLNVPQVYQKYDQWCWAGCSQAIFNFYGKNINQEQIAQEGTRGLNIWNWLWGVTNNPYRKGIKELLQVGGIPSYGLTNSLSQNQLQSEISSQKPVIVRWGWDNGGGHFVICKGISGNTTYIMDPWSGPTINSYNWLRRGNGHTWTSTLKTSR